MGRGAGSYSNNKTSGTRSRDILAPTQPIELIRVASEKNRAALVWAENAHRDQLRKQTPNSLNGERVPYIIHTVTVQNILSAAGADRNLVCAGILHDIVEDTFVTIEQIREEFGNRVAALVQAVTKDKTFKGIRLEEQAGLIVKKCEPVGEDAFALKAADLLANLSDLVWTAEDGGIEAIKELFGAHRWERKVRHYFELADLLCDRLPSYPRLAEALQTRKSELKVLLGL